MDSSYNKIPITEDDMGEGLMELLEDYEETYTDPMAEIEEKIRKRYYRNDFKKL